MDNGWTTKCGSSTAPMVTHMQQQEMKDQMDINTGGYINPHDGRVPRLVSPELKSAPTVANVLNFFPSKSSRCEIENPYLSLPSARPSVFQDDFQQQSNLKTSTSCYYSVNSALNNAGKVPKWPILHNNGKFNLPPTVDVHPVIPSRPIVNYSTSHDVCDDLDALRALITCSSLRDESGCTTSPHKALFCAPSGMSECEMSCGLESNMMLESPSEVPSSVAKKPTSIVSGCPHVFCMGACGDLLLSNTGLLGILCSCHGLHMSVANFCKHSGLFDVNPGYAVCMESGESIALWRKLYLLKFGHGNRGW